MENRIKDRQKRTVQCSTRITFYPFQGEMLKQHLGKCSKVNKKQLQAIVATSQVQSASTGILGAAPDQEQKRNPVGCWVSCTRVIELQLVTCVCRGGADAVVCARPYCGVS